MPRIIAIHTILSYVDVMAEAATATDTVDAGVATTASLTEVVLTLDHGDSAKDPPADVVETAQAADSSDRALDVDPDQEKFNTALGAIMATFADMAESATARDTAGYAMTPPSPRSRDRVCHGGRYLSWHPNRCRPSSGGGQRPGSGQRPV